MPHDLLHCEPPVLETAAATTLHLPGVMEIIIFALRWPFYISVSSNSMAAYLLKRD